MDLTIEKMVFRAADCVTEVTQETTDFSPCGLYEVEKDKDRRDKGKSEICYMTLCLKKRDLATTPSLRYQTDAITWDHTSRTYSRIQIDGLSLRIHTAEEVYFLRSKQAGPRTSVM